MKIGRLAVASGRLTKGLFLLLVAQSAAAAPFTTTKIADVRSEAGADKILVVERTAGFYSPGVHGLAKRIFSRKTYVMRFTYHDSGPAVLLLHAANTTLWDAGESSEGIEYFVSSNDGFMPGNMRPLADRYCGEGVGGAAAASAEASIVSCGVGKPVKYVVGKGNGELVCRLDTSEALSKGGVAVPRPEQLSAEERQLNRIENSYQLILSADVRDAYMVRSAPDSFARWPDFPRSLVLKINDCGASVDRLQISLKPGEDIVNVWDGEETWFLASTPRPNRQVRVFRHGVAGDSISFEVPDQYRGLSAGFSPKQKTLTVFEIQGDDLRAVIYSASDPVMILSFDLGAIAKGKPIMGTRR